MTEVWVVWAADMIAGAFESQEKAQVLVDHLVGEDERSRRVWNVKMTRIEVH